MAKRESDGLQEPADAADIGGYRRYAIYYAPRPEEPLAVFGAGWLGRQMDGSDCPRAPLIDAPMDQAALTRDARRYGLHGTLKAPFTLAAGLRAEALDEALRRFAASRPVAFWPGWRLSGAFGFTSLRPSGPAPALEALAAGVVAQFAQYGAALSQADLQRRRRHGLSLRQEKYLATYGYPYVLEEFSFHVTLSGQLSAEDAAALKQALESPLAAVLAERGVAVRDLCLFGEPGEGEPFRLLRRYALAPIR